MHSISKNFLVFRTGEEKKKKKKKHQKPQVREIQQSPQSEVKVEPQATNSYEARVLASYVRDVKVQQQVLEF